MRSLHLPLLGDASYEELCPDLSLLWGREEQYPASYKLQKYWTVYENWWCKDIQATRGNEKQNSKSSNSTSVYVYKKLKQHLMNWLCHKKHGKLLFILWYNYVKANLRRKICQSLKAHMICLNLGQHLNFRPLISIWRFKDTKVVMTLNLLQLFHFVKTRFLCSYELSFEQEIFSFPWLHFGFCTSQTHSILRRHQVMYA